MRRIKGLVAVLLAVCTVFSVTGAIPLKELKREYHRKPLMKKRLQMKIRRKYQTA